MQLNSIGWLSAQAPVFGRLSDNEKAAVLDFALVWSFYEARCLGNIANMERIRRYVHGLPHEVLNSPEILELVKYFQDRYAEGDKFSYRYDHLHLERSGNPEEVIRMFRGQTESHSESLIGCLGVVFRYRNNLFHGEKWAYGLQEQQENFERSTSLLCWLMEQKA
jgi:hypothetical protein